MATKDDEAVNTCTTREAPLLIYPLSKGNDFVNKCEVYFLTTVCTGMYSHVV